MKICGELPGTTRVAVYLIAIAAGVGSAVLLYKLLGPVRRGTWPVRLLGRVLIIGGGLAAFGLTALTIGGRCIFVGQSKYGGYISDPISAQGILTMAVIAGAVAAIIVPLIARKRDGQRVDLEW